MTLFEIVEKTQKQLQEAAMRYARACTEHEADLFRAGLCDAAVAYETARFAHELDQRRRLVAKQAG